MKYTAGAWKRAVGIAIAVVLACTFVIVRTYAEMHPSADMAYRSADYQVEVQRNGDLTIREHIDVTLKKRNKPWRQLYQQYRLDPDQLTAITGVSVKDTTTGRTYTQADPDRAQRSVHATVGLHVCGTLVHQTGRSRYADV